MWSPFLKFLMWDLKTLTLLSPACMVLTLRGSTFHNLFYYTRLINAYDRYVNHCFFSRFRSVYDPLRYLMTRESDMKTARFISTDRHLLEYGRELQKVYDLSKMAASMDLFIPMELFVLDCTKIKEVKRNQ